MLIKVVCLNEQQVDRILFVWVITVMNMQIAYCC